MHPNHVHASALDGLVTFAFVILSLAIMRGIALRWPDHPIGQAFAFLN